MCDPVSMAVTAVATTAVSLASEQQSAAAQQAAINSQLSQNYTNIAKQKQTQENDNLRAARKEGSRIKVAAGEAGLSLGSQSIETVLLNNQMQTGLADERIGLNTDIQRQNAEAEANKSLAQTSTPSLLGAGLQLGLAGYSGFKAGERLKIAKDAASVAAPAKVGV